MGAYRINFLNPLRISCTIQCFFSEVFLGFTPSTVVRKREKTGGPRPPKRPDHGTVGRPIRLRTNLFRLNISPELSDLYHYDVEITPNKCPRTVKRDVVNEIIRKYKDTTFQGHQPAFDGEKNLYSRIKLPSVSACFVKL